MRNLWYERNRPTRQRMQWRPIFVALLLLGVTVYCAALLVESTAPAVFGQACIVVGVVGWLYCWIGHTL